jgi:hypothetical protein
MSLSTFTAGDTAPTVRTKLNAVVNAVNTLDGGGTASRRARFFCDTDLVLAGYEGQVSIYPYLGAESGYIQPGYEGSGGRTYIEAVAEVGSAYLEIVVWEWETPPDWSAWNVTQAVGFELYTTDTGGNSYLSVATYRRPVGGGAPVAGGTLVSQKTAAVWTTVWLTASALAGGTWAAGDVLVVAITMHADQTAASKVARLGSRIVQWTVTT